MLLPLGLGIQFKKHQWVSYALVLLCISAFLFSPRPSSINKKIAAVFSESAESKIVGKLYLEYCISRVTDRKKCLFSKPFFQLKRRKGEYERSKKTNFKKVLDDMGSAYQETPHYLKFYQKLFNDDLGVRKLPSFSEYKDVQNTFFQQATEIYKANHLLSKMNNTMFVNFIAIFSSVGVIHLLWNLFILIIFGRYVEKRLGRIQYFITYSLIGILIIRLYVSTLSADNIQFVIGAGAPISFLIGFFYITFYKLKFKIAILKFGRPSYIHVGLKFIIPLLYLAQEVLLLVTSQVNLPHRAHFSGLMLGLILAFVWQKLSRLEGGFIFPSEYKQWIWLKKQENDQLFFNSAMSMLEENPSNHTIRDEIVVKIKEKIAKGEEILKYLPILDSILPFYLGQHCKDKDGSQRCLEVLSILPFEQSMKKYFIDLSHHDLFLLLKNSNFEKYPFLKIQLICSYYDLLLGDIDLVKFKLDLNELVEMIKDQKILKPVLFQISQTMKNDTVNEVIISCLRELNVSNSG